jgi:hypothetical protein
MREIKFRFWKKEAEKMLPDVFAPRTPTFGDVVGLIQMDFEMMQFSGLKDKNGKEIYEGDIVRFIVDGTIDTVEFKTGAFKTHGIVLSELGTDTHEVIGNIYENPDLLKSRTKGG